MTWSSDYLEELRGKHREKFQEKAEAKGVGFARAGKAAEEARRVHDRGIALKETAAAGYEKHRNRWVLKEYSKLQTKASSSTPEYKPEWAQSNDKMMEQAQKNVWDRYQSRIRKIDDTTVREVARVRREHARDRKRDR